MIEIIAAVYVTSFTLSWVTITATFFYLRNLQLSERMHTVETNLNKAGAYWSTVQAQIIESPADQISELRRKDYRSSLRSYLFISAGISLLSAPGLLLNLIVAVSMIWLARPRLERAILRGPLAHNPNLTEDEVRAEILRIQI